MTATPITEKFHPIAHTAGLPAMDRIHDADSLTHETYLANLGQIVEGTFRDVTCRAMLVTVPTDTEFGDFMVLDGDTFAASRAAGANPGNGRIGVMLAGVDANVNNLTGDLYGWMVIEGRAIGRMAAGVADGDVLTNDAANPGQANTGGALDLGARATSAVATASDTVAVPATLQNYGIGYGEVYIRG